ncbi:FtsX-like permease family protein [Pseudoflavonifractor phocaeensis]|uniref:FtsX-like permease family protein n=1 Tax=Pseudoflavonifractor phocaeensis TaxID=1870988 RepID=UPI00228570C2|nr:FtsX-like permease family protein [Pseudoflavonifractor phocaeensis]MCF2597047.1 FtsX-like permease family protein [Pseudoflavonifractor phocaeensis]
MFFKLALRNVRRSFRDYGVYLLTLTFGVCLFYTFNAIEGQGAMVYLSRNDNPMVSSILMLIDIFSVFVAVVLACLILYADRFLLRRRKRELGTYLLLGLTQGQVSRLLFLETGVVGLLSLAAGLALGVPASWGMSALTLSMFEVDVSGLLGLSFSWRAAGKTVLYFGLIFLLVMGFSGLEVSRARLIDLLQGERKNEVLKQRPLGWAVVQLALGAVCLAAAYAILLFFGMAIAVAVLPICIPMLTLGTLGTLLIFKSLSGFVLKFARERPGFYYKNLNLFTLRQWISKVHTTYLSQTVICILLLLAIGITASSVGLNSTLEQMTGQQAPFDLTVQNQSADWTGPEDFEGVLAEGGFDLKRLDWTADVPFYYNDPAVTGTAEASAALRLSDYDALLARQGRPGYTGVLPFLQADRNEGLVTGNLGLTYVVIPDEMAEGLELRRQVWCADYVGDKEKTESDLLALLRPLSQKISLRVESRLTIYQDVMGSKILALYLGLYLGFTFLLAAAAVLALQQLSQAADNTRRYAVLRRLGAEEKLVARSAAHQVALAFLLPLGLALIHAAVGMKAANDLIAMVGRVDSVGSSLAAALVLLLVYGGYFLATAAACRRMARNA